MDLQRILTFTLSLTVAVMTTYSQIQSRAKEKSASEREGSAWHIMFPLASPEPSYIDTISYNYQRQAIPSFISPVYITTGNLGAEGETAIFFDRKPKSAFIFQDALDAWIPTFDKEKFYNVYTPVTIASFNTGGGKQNVQERLRANFAGNVNRRIGIGALFDYLYSKGAYESQATKDFVFGFSGYYKGERYQMQAFFNQYNMLNKENGGITDPLYITDPAELQGGIDKIEPKSIPTRLSNAHTRVYGKEFFMNHAYNVGYWTNQVVNDTLTREIYIPVTKFLYTFDYRGAKHVFSNTNSAQGREFWENRYLSTGDTYDKSTYWSVSNSLGISLLEGFRKWVKFGLSAYVTHEYRRYNQTPDTLSGLNGFESGLTPLPVKIDPSGSQNILNAGAILSKTQGSILTYQAKLRLGLIGDESGDIELDGNISTKIPLLGDTVRISAKGHFRNTAQSYFLQHFLSNHFAWNNNFGKTRSFRVGGELNIPWTHTSIEAGFENLQNYVYFNSQGLPQQHVDNIQIFCARLNQQLKFGIWNWDNSIIYQTSSNSEVIPLPTLAIYSNMYLKFIAFRVLTIQFGVDCSYYTRFYAPEYQPATMAFCNQNHTKIGNYPFMNAYLTCKLKKTRFFLMMSHVNQGWFSKEYFSMPGYPLNPRKFQLGISVDFIN